MTAQRRSRGRRAKALVFALCAWFSFARVARGARGDSSAKDASDVNSLTYPRLVVGTFKGTYVVDARSRANVDALRRGGQSQGTCALTIRSKFARGRATQSIAMDIVFRDDEYVKANDVRVPLEGVYVERTGAIVAHGEEKTTERFLRTSNASATANASWFDASAYRRTLRAVANDALSERMDVHGKTRGEAREGRDSYMRGDGVGRASRSARVEFVEEETVGTYPRVCAFTLHGYVKPGNFSGEEPVGSGTRAERMRELDDEDEDADVLDEQMEDARPLEFGDMPSETSLVGKFVSDNCGLIVHVELKSQSVRVFYRKVRFYAYLLLAVIFAQGHVLVRQIDASSTSASMMRFSIATVGMRSVIDSYFCLAHLTMGILIDELFAPLGMVAGGYFVLFSILEMRLLVQAWRARNPQSQGWFELRADLSAVYSRFYAAFIFGLLLMYWTADKFIVFLLVMNSYWIPQIVRNAYLNQRQVMEPSFIIATSYLRLIIPLYAFGCPSNFMHLRPNYAYCIALVIWTTAQVAVLMCQHYISPRYGVESWSIFPEVYDYYRNVPEDVLAQCGFIDGDDATGERDIEMGNVTSGADCVICMNHVKIRSSSERMVTPCNHFFHPECLTRWIDIKQECPTCRRALPPLSASD